MTKDKVVVLAAMMAAPGAAFALENDPSVYAFVGGAIGGGIGGLLGALLACWFCCRRRDRAGADVKKY